MLPRENSLTYVSDLIEHYREVDPRIRTAPFKPKPGKPRPRLVERPGVAPEPEDKPQTVHEMKRKLLSDEMDAAFAELGEELTAKIRTPHPCTRIINEVCREHDITREELISPCRTLHLARIRQLAMWRCRQAGISLPVIGRYFGNRDHTTVLHACRKIEAAMREGDAS